MDNNINNTEKVKEPKLPERDDTVGVKSKPKSSLTKKMLTLLAVLVILGSIVYLVYINGGKERLDAYYTKNANEKIEECFFDKKCKDVELTDAEKKALAEGTGLDPKEFSKIVVKGKDANKEKDLADSKDKNGKNSKNSKNGKDKSNINTEDADKILKADTSKIKAPGTKEFEGANNIKVSKGKEAHKTPDGRLALQPGVVGFFYADKIGLLEPIYQGASQYNLARGVATVGSSETLDEGNVAIAGHRAWGYGVRFNRLSELGIGDTVKVRTANTTTEYKVYKRMKVTPKDVSVLDETKDKELTLITCESYDYNSGNFKERLVLKLKKI